MKILQISSDYFETIVYRNLYAELQNRVDLEVVVPLARDKKTQFENKICPQNVKSLFLGNSQFFGIQLNSSKFAKHIISNGISNKIDLVHAHYVFNDGSIALKIKKKIGIPYTVSVRTSCMMNFDRKIAIHNYIHGLKVLNNATTIFFQSSKVLENLLKKIPSFYHNEILNKHYIIPNGIDNFWHENVYNNTNSFSQKDFTIITAASIEYNKNLGSVAKAIENLNQNGYKIKYFIAGPLVEKSILIELKLYNFIEYLGVLNREFLLKAYRQSNIFIMVSHNETFGLVYGEAMSQGLPIIYTKGEGFDGQFEEGKVGYPVSSNSIEEIEEAILKVVKGYKNLSSNAIKNIDKFNWNKIADKYYRIYIEVLKNKI